MPGILADCQDVCTWPERCFSKQSSPEEWYVGQLTLATRGTKWHKQTHCNMWMAWGLARQALQVVLLCQCVIVCGKSVGLHDGPCPH